MLFKPDDYLGFRIDDLVLFSAASQLSQLWQFHYRYSWVMEQIGFVLQPWTGDLLKSFAPSCRGQVFGIYIDTVANTWTFPPRKLALLLQFVEQCIE